MFPTLFVLLEALTLSGLSMKVMFTKDRKKRRSLQTFLEAPLGACILLSIFWVLVWQRETISSLFLLLILFVLFGLPALFYPFSPAFRDAGGQVPVPVQTLFPRGRFVRVFASFRRWISGRK